MTEVPIIKKQSVDFPSKSMDWYVYDTMGTSIKKELKHLSLIKAYILK